MSSTIEKMNSIVHFPEKTELILTRYLYNKDKIVPVLTNAILSHNIEESLFWAFELYYSGFNTEIFYILGVIYRMHYEIGNPKLVDFIHQLVDKSETIYPLDHVMLNIILNLICRECNPIKESTLRVWVSLEELPKYIEKYANIIKSPPQIPNKVLSIACKYSLLSDTTNVVDEDDVVNQNTDIIESENYKKYWLYYANRSPIWNERIIEYGGVVDDLICKITFPDDTYEDRFYEKYGYEPDEQPINIQEKCLGIKLSNIFTSFAK